MGEDEHDFNIATQERIDALGFKPQKEIGYNHLLPYADELDEESARLFEEIKCNLGKVVLLREMKPGCGVWTSRLIKYIKIFGLKFSKADHIALIKLVYELVVTPDLEPTKLHKFATLLILLIKKKFLISPEELTLDWRPLYDVGQKMFTKGTTTLGMFHYTPRKITKHDDEETQINPTLATIQRMLKITGSEDLESFLASSRKDESLENTFEILITFVKPYFPLSATSEILAELRPRMSPWSSESRQAMEELMLFLPVTLKPEQYHLGPGIWFEEMLGLWDVCQNSVYGEAEMMLLFASLAQNIPGHVDWDPYLPGMFARFLRTFNLPVGFKQQQSARQHSLDIYSMAVWIVWTIGPNTKTQEYLESFMKTIETYLQSANVGRWSIKLREFLKKLPQQFLLRVHRERHYKYRDSWENKVPDGHKLRDDDITRFVESMLEPVLAATCSRVGSSDACTALQHLATLRPALAAPPALLRFAATADSLTEPHRHVAAMQAVVAVARPMLRGQDTGYPEGPTHVVPLLLAALPGLDPNDLKKTLVTLHFVSIFCTMMPLVDCSTAAEHYPDLTEEEHIVCESTAMFEDFVLQYFDRIFGLIESSTMEQTRMELKDPESFRSKSESIAEGALASSTTIILMQSSPSIFNAALRKFHNFAIDRIFETKVAGQSVGYICRAFSRVNSKESFKVFLPQLCQNITDLIGDGDAIFKEEILSNELLYNLQLLSHLLEGKGTDLLPYIPMLVELWDKALRFAAKEGYMFACEALSHAMISMSSLYANEFRSSPSDYGSHVKDFLPIREWGRSARMRATKIDWHTPNSEEIACVQMLLDRYLPSELERLNGFVSGQLQLTREQLHRSLYTISSILTCNYLLPVEDEEPVQFVDSLVPASAFLLTVGVTGAVSLAGRNVRAVVADTMHVLQDMLQEKHPDDTKNLCMLIQIWEQLSAAWSRGPRTAGLGNGSLEARARTLAVAKRVLAGKGGGPGSDGLVRALLGDRALLQHETRVEIRASAGVGESGVRLLRALLELSVHPYSIIRIRAQHRLHWLVSRHAYSWHALVPRVSALLASASHEQLKGALHVLLGPRSAPLVAKQDWAVARVLWPAVLRSTASEKTSVIKLLNSVVDAIQRHFPTIAIRLTVTDACVAAGAALVPAAERAHLAVCEANGPARLEECSRKNEETYLELIDELVSAAESTELQWRYSSMAMTLLPCAVHLQTPYPPHAVRLAVRSLLHDSLPVRKAAVRLTLYALKQRKRKHVKIEVDPYEIAGVEKPGKVVPGYRPDNAWVVWDADQLPTTQALWDQPRYVNTIAVGYYAWPEKLKVYAPYGQQPQLDRKRSELDEAEGEIFDFFSDQTNIDKLIGFLSMEDKKGRDKFNGYRYEMFKSLFRNYGDVFLPLFLPHLKRLISSSQESHQRCAAEIVAGLLCAPKHWSFDMNERLWAELEPLLENAFMHMTAETVEDWGCCIATGADGTDPRRSHRLPILLLRLARAGASSAAAVCARLYALQGALAAQSWRMAPLASCALQCLRELYLEHPYQNVRERVGAFLVSIFDLDMEFPGSDQRTAPRVDDFMREITMRLRPLYDADGEVIIVRQGTATSEPALLSPDEGLDEKAAAAFADLSKAHSHALGLVLKDITSDVSIDAIKAACADYGGEAAALVAATGSTRAGNVERLRRRLSLALDVSGEGGAPAAPSSDYDVAVNLLKTVLRFCVGAVVRGARGARPAHYALLRAACALSGRGADDELARLCDAYLAVLAHSLHAAPVFAVALDAVEEVLSSRSWWARAACVTFTQTLLFHSLPLVRGTEAARVRVFVLARMRDERVEVRDAAAKLLAGLMHCGVVEGEDEMLDEFRTLCRVRGGAARGSPAALARLHCGVLGLCAYVAARPYTLPPRLAEVCAELANHLNDPDPIPATIRKTLSDFKRTHQDEWTTHKAKLSEYELELLSELTSPPSYYA